MKRLLWCGALLLALIGVTVAIARAVWTGDLATRAMPMEQRIAGALHRPDPPGLDRSAAIRLIDVRYEEHPWLGRLHVLPGALVMVLAPLQFTRRIRTRYPRFHRWTGRTVLMASLLTAVPAVYFGIMRPFAGIGEAIVVAVFEVLFLTALGIAFTAIRKKQVERHREWMLRAMAIAFGISTARIVGPAADLALVPLGYQPEGVFVLAISISWSTTLAAAEAWIRYTRPRAAALVPASITA